VVGAYHQFSKRATQAKRAPKSSVVQVKIMEKKSSSAKIMLAKRQFQRGPFAKSINDRKGIRPSKTASPGLVRPTDICAMLAQVRQKHTTLQKESFVLLESKKKPGESEEAVFRCALVLMKGILFKHDMPYRTKLHAQSTVVTTSGNVVNTNYLVSNVSAVTEWSSINSLFDEAFVHSMTVRFSPINIAGGGIGLLSVVNAGGTTAAYASNAALVMCSLFTNSAAYGSAVALANNASRAFHHSAHPFSYSWKNNVKFEKHGLALNTSIVTGWQGWFQILDAAEIGGSVQIRAVNDTILGSGGTTTLGTVDLEYDVSFRSRA